MCVKQGCILSPLNLNVAIDLVMRPAVPNENGINPDIIAKLYDLDYANDTCLVSHNLAKCNESLT